MSATNRIGYPVIDEILERIAPTRDDDDGLEMSDNSCGECGHPYKAGDETHYPECSRLQVDTAATVATPGFTNYRVVYSAPTKPEHQFEPSCWIEADSVEHGASCRVFDVPDPDEGQRAVAQLACDALNQRAEQTVERSSQTEVEHGPINPFPLLKVGKYRRIQSESNKAGGCTVFVEGMGLTTEQAGYLTRAVNNHAGLVEALERIRTWLVSPATDAETIAEMRQVVGGALARVRDE